MSGKNTGIIIGLFLITISLLLLGIQDKNGSPEIAIYLISAVLTMGIIFSVNFILKRKERDKHQEN